MCPRPPVVPAGGDEPALSHRRCWGCPSTWVSASCGGWVWAWCGASAPLRSSHSACGHACARRKAARGLPQRLQVEMPGCRLATLQQSVSAWHWGCMHSRQGWHADAPRISTPLACTLAAQVVCKLCAPQDTTPTAACMRCCWCPPLLGLRRRMHVTNRQGPR